MFSVVVTVCDQASAERCPIFPGMTKRPAWSYEIEAKIMAFVAEASHIDYWIK